MYSYYLNNTIIYAYMVKVNTGQVENTLRSMDGGGKNAFFAFFLYQYF